MNHHSHNVQVFFNFMCNLGIFFEKIPHEAILSHFSWQSFTKRKSQDTLIFSLLAGSGNCCTNSIKGYLKCFTLSTKILIMNNGLPIIYLNHNLLGSVINRVNHSNPLSVNILGPLYTEFV